MKTVIITGGRDYAFTDADYAALDALHAEHRFTLVIEGGCRRRDYRGDTLPTADYCGWRWARSRKIQTATMDANWDEHSKAAGPIRNSAMCDLGVLLMSVVIAFPGGKGTTDMKTRAERAGLKVLRLDGITAPHALEREEWPH